MPATKKDKLIRIKFLDSYASLVDDQLGYSIEDAIADGYNVYSPLSQAALLIPVAITCILDGDKIRFEFALSLTQEADGCYVSHCIDGDLIAEYGDELLDWLGDFSEDIADHTFNWLEDEAGRLTRSYA